MTEPLLTPHEKFPNYLLAEEDTALLKRPELRAVRLQLELIKPDLILEEAGIVSTLVVFGGTQILEREVAEKRLISMREIAANDPANAMKQRDVGRAERVLA
ncbi:MAG: 3-isopropylmalate dehydrogenase, partial [Pirellulaceae bacterium]